MRQQVNEEVSVLIYYDQKKKQVVPYRLVWRTNTYDLGPVDYYHRYMEGQERQHIFELCDTDETIWFRLRLNTSNLHWILEVTHDGNPD